MSLVCHPFIRKAGPLHIPDRPWHRMPELLFDGENFCPGQKFDPV